MNERLHGFWRLLSYKERRNGDYVDALGPDAKGFITYSPTGSMSVLITGGQRRLNGAWDEIPPADKAANYDRLVAYAGRYEEHDDRVVHHVEVCWIPNWIGRRLVRRVRMIAPDRLELSTVADANGLMPLDQVLEWERLADR